MIKTYNLLDGGIITATSPEDFVTQLREGSRFDSECTNQEFMVNFARRYRELYGIDVASDSFESFVDSLVIAGYILAACFGMIDFSGIASSGIFQLPQPLYFGVRFEPSACVAIGVLFAINSIQAIGDLSATTVGSMDREPTTKELQGGILMYGIENIIGAVFGGLPTATYSQNVGIVTTTKVINRCVLGLAAVVLIIAGLVPKFSALLTTIPQCVLGGATISVFASIAMTGIKLVMQQEMNYRNTSIVGLSVALGMGVTQASASLSAFPDWVTTIFGSSPVVLATIVAILLNLILPKEEKKQSVSKK